MPPYDYGRTRSRSGDDLGGIYPSVEFTVRVIVVLRQAYETRLEDGVAVGVGGIEAEHAPLLSFPGNVVGGREEHGSVIPWRGSASGSAEHRIRAVKSLLGVKPSDKTGRDFLEGIEHFDGVVFCDHSETPIE